MSGQSKSHVHGITQGRGRRKGRKGGGGGGEGRVLAAGKKLACMCGVCGVCVVCVCVVCVVCGGVRFFHTNLCVRCWEEPCLPVTGPLPPPALASAHQINDITRTAHRGRGRGGEGTGRERGGEGRCVSLTMLQCTVCMPTHLSARSPSLEA